MSSKEPVKRDSMEKRSQKGENTSRQKWLASSRYVQKDSFDTAVQAINMLQLIKHHCSLNMPSI